MIALKLVLEGLGLGFLLYLICAIGIRNGAVGMVHLYDQKVQERVVQLGLSTAEEIRKRAERNPRIRFFGFLADRAELLRLQQRATVMVNMRDPGAEASAYCFPSKIFEGLLMEKPVLSCRLPGIPGEYFGHLVGMKSIDPADIAEAIRLAACMPPERGRRGAEFVAREKNNLVQAKRILDFIKEA